MTIGSCSFHHRVSQGLYFHLEASNETAKITGATNVQFSDCCCQELSQTRSLAVAGLQIHIEYFAKSLKIIRSDTVE